MIVSFPPPLDRLPPDAASALAEHLHAADFPQGSCLFTAGSAADCCYVIDKGQVRVELDQPEWDSDSVLGYVEPGSFLGEVSILDGLPRSAGAYAHTHVEARRITTKDLEELAASAPSAYAAVIGALGRNAALSLRRATDKLADVVFSEKNPEIDELTARAAAAQREIQGWPEARVDALLHTMATAVVDRGRELAEATVAATGIGNVEDKITKNHLASFGVYTSLVGKCGQGLLSTDERRHVSEFATPVGVVLGLIPVTGPIATACFKALICVKSRNALILSFQSSALKLAPMIGEILHDALRKHDAPVDWIQWVKSRSSRRTTNLVMRHPGVSLILATGGTSMVRAAYSSGKPAIGVGPGNAPALIAGDADLDHAARSIVMSKSFDNGLICASENHVVVNVRVRDAMVAALERHGVAVLLPDEVSRLSRVLIDPERGYFAAHVIGQSAARLAQAAEIKRPYVIKMITVPIERISHDNPYAREKLMPVTSLVTAASDEEGISLSRELLRIEGMGHTAVIHSRDKALIDRFSAALPVSRILVNCPAFQGAGGLCSGLVPSFTLGCGTFGGNSTTDNVSYHNLLNIKRVADFVAPPDAP
jgi:acyl-CoA reductase-like NAD-dependent aldehyde dehydrogenase